jgi:hypothetical protein
MEISRLTYGVADPLSKITLRLKFPNLVGIDQLKYQNIVQFQKRY